MPSSALKVPIGGIVVGVGIGIGMDDNCGVEVRFVGGSARAVDGGGIHWEVIERVEARRP